MLQENIKALRKERGLTQEELAIRVNVVRQTVSKWEKGLSVPDADLLQKIADVLEVTVSQLLGAESETAKSRNEIAEQLSRINEQLAIKNRRAKQIFSIIKYAIIAYLCFLLLLSVLGFCIGEAYKGPYAAGPAVKENVEVVEIATETTE